MKQYYNTDTKHHYYEGDSLTLQVNGVLFSGIPTEQQLIDWGYTEYEEAQVPVLLEYERMNDILAELKSMDYLTSKYIDGEDMSAYGDWQERRKALRNEYRELEEQLKNKNS